MVARIVALGLISLHIAQAIICYDGTGYVVTPKGCRTGRCGTFTEQSNLPIRLCDDTVWCNNVSNSCVNLTEQFQMCCCDSGDLCNGFDAPWPPTECYSGDGQDQNNWSNVLCNAGWCARKEDSNQKYTRYCDTSDLCSKSVGNDCLTLANGSVICCCNDKLLCNGLFMTTTPRPTTTSASTLPSTSTTPSTPTLSPTPTTPSTPTLSPTPITPSTPTLPPILTTPAPPFQCYVGGGYDPSGWSRQVCDAKLCFKDVSSDNKTVTRGCAMNGCTISAQLFCESDQVETSCCCSTSLCNGALKSVPSGMFIILGAVSAAMLMI